MIKASARGHTRTAVRLKVAVARGELVYSIKGPPAAPEALSWLLREVARDLAGS